MKKALFILGFILMVSGPAFATTQVNEVADNAAVTTFDIGTSTVSLSSSTLVAQPFAYNITNNDSSVTLYCGYSQNVSTSGNYQGFKVLPGATEYRATTETIYCKAASTISVTREIFGKNY